MSLNNNKQEIAAISKLEDAFKKCAELGIRFSVMDSTLHFANKRMYAKAEIIAKREETRRFSGAYPVIAYCQDVDNKIKSDVNTHNSMDSSGGW